MGVSREGSAQPQRAMRRCAEPSRLEEEFWKLAYQQLWPLVSRSTGGARRDPANRQQKSPSGEADAQVAGA
jgi:hypothetical protein